MYLSNQITMLLILFFNENYNKQAPKISIFYVTLIQNLVNMN